MRVRASFAICVAALALAAACAARPPKPAATPEAAPSAPPAAPASPASSASSLVGSAWLLEDIGGREVIDRVAATLTFPEPGKVAGSGSCNQFSGTVTITGNAIAFGVAASTRMACIPSVIDQEAAYLEALRHAERFEHDELFLTIYCKGGSTPLKFIRASHP